MSTESGLPDFRSATGLWKCRPETLATLEAHRHMPDEFYFFYQWRIAKLWGVKPNLGHELLARIQNEGGLRSVITQNVDGLHQRAGSQEIVELHGTLRTVSCLCCGTHYNSKVLLPRNEDWESEYRSGSYHYGDECKCPKCDGLLRPDVVLFGEALPESAWSKAMSLCNDADFFVVIGSSLAVSPANMCPQIAKANGAKLLIINQEPTALDDLADWVIHESSGKALSDIYSAYSQFS